ncbi:MAG: lipoprotein [Aggregatilineales bacterium]
MRYLRSMIILVIVAVILVACGETEPLPTIAPSPAPTETPTITNTVPATATDTATLTPTLTPTVTASTTATSTLTSTAFPTATATASQTLTPTITPTATLTPLPSSTPTPPEPVITVFSSSLNTAQAGDSLILRWESQADTARLQRLNQAGLIQEDTTVPPVGTLTVTVPGGETTVIYRLIAERGGREVLNSLTIGVAAQCAFAWFFTVPDGTPCAGAAALSVTGAYQPFQQGFMFRIQINGTDKVCGAQNDRNVYTCRNFLAYSGTPPSTPPPDAQPPAADFQDLYHNGLAIGGFWTNVIGWATAAANPAPLTAQLDVNNAIYIRLPGGVYRFDASLSNGNLTRIAQ